MIAWFLVVWMWLWGGVTMARAMAVTSDDFRPWEVIATMILWPILAPVALAIVASEGRRK